MRKGYRGMVWNIKIEKTGGVVFEKKDHGQAAGIPALKTIWGLFDLSFSVLAL